MRVDTDSNDLQSILNEVRDVVRIRAMGQTFVVPNHHSTPSKGTTKPIKELTTISEDGSPPASLSSPPSPRMATEQSDYRDIVSKFGVLSLPLQPSIDKRRSVTQIDSPDDVLMSGSTSLVASELTSPADEFNTSIAPSQDPLNDPPKDQTKDSLPVAVDLPSVGGKWDPSLPHAISALVQLHLHLLIQLLVFFLQLGLIKLYCTTPS